MAILISKQRAQSKGAVTLKPFANSTFTECLFLLEDTMKAPRARQIARKKFKETYNWKDMPKSIVVHHEDGNPFNNTLENLKPMRISRHTSHHLKGKIRSSTSLEKLDSLLIIFNDR